MANKNKIDGFNVPYDYFDNLASRINNNVFVATLKENQKHSGFITPNLYFDNLTKLSKIATNKKNNKLAKVISFYANKYVTAACILLITTLSIFLYKNQNTNIQTQLNLIPNEDIELYLLNETNTADMPVIIENIENTILPVNQSISNKDLNEYLTETI